MYNNITDADPSWLLSEATFEKMGVLMAENSGRLLGLYDEMSALLTKIKLYSSELAMFLELYNANPWTRTTGWLLTAAIGLDDNDMIFLVTKDTQS